MTWIREQWIRFLVFAGYRSHCCLAETYFPMDGYDHSYCSLCHRRCE